MFSEFQTTEKELFSRTRGIVMWAGYVPEESGGLGRVLAPGSLRLGLGGEGAARVMR